MKKGLLLSVVASTMIFAGGDIAPVEPAAPASADFWGQVGFRYEWNDNGADLDLGDKENNKFSAVAILGVEKQLAYGFGFGVEVAGWSDFGFDIADKAAVSGEIYEGSYDQTDAEVSQAYLTYTFGNTAIKAGRQALPKAVSPWAWSDRSAGVLDIAYDAIVIANTDIQDTTLVGAWVANAVNGNSPTHLGESNEGIWMLAAVNKSLANTTLTVSAYYAPNFNLTDATLRGNFGATEGLTSDDEWSIWASAVTNFDGVTAGLQLAYVDGSVDYFDTANPADDHSLDATFGIAGKIGSQWGDLDATAYVYYINDGEYSLKTAGTGVGTSAFWGSSIGGHFGGDTAYGYSQWGLRATAGYKLPVGKLWGELAYVDYDEKDPGDHDNTWGGRIGYNFTIAGVDASVQYRYWSEDYKDSKSLDKQRIRVEAYYKF